MQICTLSFRSYDLWQFTACISFSSQRIDLTELIDDDSDPETEAPNVKQEAPIAPTPFASTSQHATSAPINADEELAHSLAEGVDWSYGLLQPEQTILIRAYSDDADDSLLAEVQPRFIVMYEPSLEFVRRVEVRLLLLKRIHIACTDGVA